MVRLIKLATTLSILMIAGTVVCLPQSRDGSTNCNLESGTCRYFCSRSASAGDSKTASTTKQPNEKSNEGIILTISYENKRVSKMIVERRDEGGNSASITGPNPTPQSSEEDQITTMIQRTVHIDSFLCRYLQKSRSAAAYRRTHSRTQYCAETYRLKYTLNRYTLILRIEEDVGDHWSVDFFPRACELDDRKPKFEPATGAPQPGPNKQAPKAAPIGDLNDRHDASG